jgi:endopeptidase La
MKLKEYIDYIIKSYNLYLQLKKLSFVNIMKKFISDGVVKMFEVIFILLLCPTNNFDTASLLLNITKEKKINTPQIYNLIFKRLPFYMQLKINRGNDNIKNEIEKIKKISINTIDYKKQLITIKNIPPNIRNITLDKIEEMKAQNNDYYKQKCFVEHILKYPWSLDEDTHVFNDECCKVRKEKIKNYLNNIKLKLNSFTYGHLDAKNILLQTVANWITNPESSGKAIGLVGPPGVGKTILAKSIAESLNIPFSEILLGGQNDGELLYGHGYTYSGSQPGLIIKKMVEMNSQRCILYFDELDKTTTKHGNINEITSILIHLTDPNTNKSFQDRFFQGIDFPLNKIIMIFSYNDSTKIDPILLDRFNEIKIKPYNINDKLEIVKNFIIPELKKNIGIDSLWTNLSDDIIEYIINNYTNEAGVRDIKRKIEQIFLSINLDILTDNMNENNYLINIEEITKILTQPNNDFTKINIESKVGIINGLYATTNGEGGIIQIQIYNNYTSTNFELKITGKQGDVMKESLNCALTCAINYVTNKNIEISCKTGFHVHAPSASVSKDGPSAGSAFTLAFISRLLNKPIKNNIAITGEIDLTGKITKIGGLDFKLIGAKKAGIELVYIPLENSIEFNDIIKKYPTLIDNNFKVEIIEYIDDIIDKVFV